MQSAGALSLVQAMENPAICCPATRHPSCKRQRSNPECSHTTATRVGCYVVMQPSLESGTLAVISRALYLEHLGAVGAGA